MWSSARCPKNFTYGCIVPFKHSTQIMWQSQSTNLASNKSWNPLHAQLQWILNGGSTKTYQKHEARAVSTTGHRREFSCCLFVGNLLEQFEALPGRELAFTYPDWLGEHMAEMQTPFILLHGTGDKVTDPDTSQKMYDVAAAKDKTIKLLGWFLSTRYLALTWPPLIRILPAYSFIRTPNSPNIASSFLWFSSYGILLFRLLIVGNHWWCPDSHSGSLGLIVVRLYDGVYHAELFSCMPGSHEGLEWTKEELEATRVCLQDSAAWMAERCRWAGLNWAMKLWIGSKYHAPMLMPL